MRACDPHARAVHADAPAGCCFLREAVAIIFDGAINDRVINDGGRARELTFTRIMLHGSEVPFSRMVGGIVLHGSEVPFSRMVGRIVLLTD